MKKIYLGLLGLLLLTITNSSFATFNNQGFKSYTETENGINFECDKECFMVLGELGTSDYIKISGEFSGSGGFGYGFVNGKQIVPGDGVVVNGTKQFDNQYSLSELNFYSQLTPKIPVVIFIQSSVSGKGINIELGQLGLGASIASGFSDALKYREYNPRTINFLEGPTWNGKYINEVFFWRIVLLLALCFGLYFLMGKKSKTPMYLGIGVLVFFWVFFDFFSTVNEYRIYNEATSATNIMQNGRVGKSSDFYQFIEFAKQNIPKGEKGAFIAPYPFDFEGKYHIYPDVKFDSIDKVKYILSYNPYGPNSPFNFKDPVYDSGILIWDKYKLNVVKEIKYSNTAKIYIIK